MNFFQKFLLLFSSKKEVPQLALVTNPLNLKLGSLVNLNSGFAMLTAGVTSVRGFGADESVYAKGVIELGQGVRLHRYYLNDLDFMLQVKTSGYDDNFVDEMMLFNYVDMQAVGSQAELTRLAGKDSKIGLPTYELGDQTYERIWGDEDGLSELVKMQEKVANPTESYNVQHLSMLYTRKIDLSGREEFLLFSVEEAEGENGELEVQLSTAVGITLFATDINVI